VPTGRQGSSVGRRSCRFDEQGNATAVWHHSLGESTALQAAGYDAAGPRLLGLSIPVSGTVGVPVSFAVSPLDAWSPVATTNWSFGDGQSATDEIVSHTYAKPGTFTVGVSSSDTLDNTTNRAASITIAPAAGTTNPAGTQPSPATLTLTDLSQKHRKWREGTTKAPPTRTQKKPSPVGTNFAFTLNETATVTLAFTQTAAGRRVLGKCQPAARHNGENHRCRRTVNRGTLTDTATAGRHRLAFQGRVTSGRLPLGAYTVTLTATNVSGQRSRPHALRFTIVR
jgi:PKD domain